MGGQVNWDNAKDWAPHTLPANVICDLVWAWRWSRPCTVRDIIHLQTWVRLGLPGGAISFLESEEPVWMLHLLRRCYPEVRLEDLAIGIGIFCGSSSSRILKQRRHLNRDTNLLREIEPAIKDQIKSLPPGAELINEPWDEDDKRWMAEPGSLHGNSRGGAITELDLEPLSVVRWFVDRGAFEKPEVNTGELIRAWTVSAHRRGSKLTGYLRPAKDGIHFRGFRTTIALDSHGWTPPNVSEKPAPDE